MLVWRKLTSAKWEDSWVERLGFANKSRLAIISLPGGKAIRIEVYALSKKEGAGLVKQFGGQLRTLQDRIFTHQSDSTREPIRIRQEIIVVSSARQKKSVAREFPERKILQVPAAMAFGTGDHATTAACLRLLVDLRKTPRARSDSGTWEILDLGTGSGILALAAKLLGASNVDAFDFDPHAVRVAKENAALNQISGINFKKTDVTAWTPRKTWDVVVANLFSEVLIKAAPAIAHATKSGGSLIFSGVMRHQEKECVAAFVSHGFRVRKTIRKGKWIAALATKV
ncbi:MAG: 50S ribosomal protein L11 methyltransferase [Chthoniobacteraceae bacterium]